MNRYPIPLMLLLILSVTLNAQSPEQQAEKKAYRSDDNRLYVNKDLGVYIWLSTSPDPDAEKIRLMSDTSSRYSNPMYFDTEGYNTVRSPSCVDTNTHKTVYPLHDIIFEVYADGISPSTRSIFNPPEAKIIKGKKYYGGTLEITLKSTDAVSGVDKLFYSLNDNTFSEYSKPLSDVREGENILKYYGTDRVGNTETVHEETLYLDNTPPKTDYFIEGNKNEKYISANALIKLTSEDQTSGVKAIYYRINNGKFTLYSSPIPVKVLAGDNATVSYYAEDQLGNKEKTKTIGSAQGIEVEGQKPDNVVFEFYVDREAPDVKIEIEVLGDQYEGKYKYVSPRTKFKITAEDQKAGVETIRYSINSSTLSNQYTEPFTLEKEGLQYVHASATDYVGNVASPLIKPFFNDIQSPVTTLKVGSPKFNSRDTLFITSGTTLSLTAADLHSGIKSIVYSIDDGELQDYTQPFKVSGSGIRTIHYRSTDNVNNQETEQKMVVFTDNEAPKIHYHFSVESIGNKIVRDENYTIYPTNVMLYIAATDSRSGGEKIEYSVNGGPLLTANPIKSLSPGNYLIEVYAYDVLGNKSKETIKFAIEE